MRKHKRKKVIIRSEPSTQLFITEFMTEKKIPKIRLEPIDQDEKRKIKLEFEDKEEDKTKKVSKKIVLEEDISAS